MAKPWEDFQSTSNDGAAPWEEFEAPKEKKKASIGTALKQSVASVGNMADTAASLIAGGAAGLFGQDAEQDEIFRNMDTRSKERMQWANPNNEDLTLAGKILGTAATLPMQIVGAGLSPAQTGVDLLNAGESLGTAFKGAGIDAAGNVAGMVLPGFKEGGALVRAATGAGANAAQEVATKAAISGIAQTDAAKQQFAPTGEDALVAGMVGGAGAAAAGRARPTQPINSDGVKFVPKNPAPDGAVVPDTTRLQQPDMFADAQPSGPMIRPAEAGAGPAMPEARGELSNRRQMELQDPTAMPERIDVDRTGEAVRSDANPWDLFARDELTNRVEAELDANLMAEQARRMEGAEQLELPRTEVQGDLFAEPSVGPYPRSGMEDGQLDMFSASERPSAEQRAVDARPSAIDAAANKGVEIRVNGNTIEAVQGGKVVGRLEPNITPEQARQINEPASIDIVKVDPTLKGQGIGSALYEKFHEMYQGAIVPSGKTTQDAWNVWKSRYPDKVEQFVQAEGQRVANGASLEQVLSNVTDPSVAQRITEQTPAYAKAPTVTGTLNKMNGLYRKQGGWIKLPFNKGPVADVLKRNEGLRERLPEIFPESLPPAEWVAKYKNAPDTDTLRNPLTKGGLYQSLKTNNPLIKRVTENVRMAVQRSQAVIRDVIHEGKDAMAPAWRRLDRTEYVKVADLLQEAARNEANIDLGSMKGAGYSDKAIQVVRQHQDMMKQMEGKLAETARANGIEAVHMRTAYAASMAAGDFRRLVYDGDKVVGILSANTRRGLNQQVEKYKKINGAATIGEERYFGGNSRSGTAEGFQQMLEFLSQNDPAIKAFVNQVNDAVSAKDYMNTKKHTMDRKGIFGMQGDKPFETDYKNAHDFAESQITYAENVIKWSEMTKAVNDAKEVMAGVEMPNAKKYLQQYLDNALGRNPYNMGRAIDSAMEAVGKDLGIGTTVGRDIMSATKKVLNTKLLGFSPGFYMANVFQPFRVMPEMKAFLSARGLDTNFDFGTGYSYMGNALVKMIQTQMGQKVDGVTQGALEYAKKNHVYSSDLFESSNSTRRGVGTTVDTVVQAFPQRIEMISRQAIFLSFVDMLHSGGIKPKDGLYEAAQNLTDISMNNYNASESPLGQNAAGTALGRSSYNLMSYKYNELSRIALFARELPKNASGRAIGANLIAQVASAGIMGTIGYQEADWLTRKISEALGKPTSISKVLLENKDEWAKYFAFGGFYGAGVDMTGRLGLNFTPDMGSPANLVLPGASALMDTAGAIGEAVKDPSEYNLKNAAREAAPIGMQGAIDRAWFSGTNGKGEELSMNRDKVNMNAVRNEADKKWKTAGLTGVNESAQKKLNWENQKTDMFYDDKRKDAVLDMKKAMFTNANSNTPLDKNMNWNRAVQKFIKYQGDPQQFNTTIERMALDLKLTQEQIAQMKNAGSTSITRLQQMKRRQ